MSLPGWAIAIAVLAALYLLFLALLLVSGRHGRAREAALFIPNLARLFHGLMRDRDVPWHAKLVLALGVGYLATPIDLIPDLIPVVGELDDAIVASLVLGYVIRASGREPVERHWHGDPRVLAKLTRR